MIPRSSRWLAFERSIDIRKCEQNIKRNRWPIDVLWTTPANIIYMISKTKTEKYNSNKVLQRGATRAQMMDKSIMGCFLTHSRSYWKWCTGIFFVHWTIYTLHGTCKYTLKAPNENHRSLHIEIQLQLLVIIVGFPTS